MPDGMSLLYAARPAIRVDEQQYDVIDLRLHAMTMREAVRTPAALELTFKDVTEGRDAAAGFGFADERILKHGAVLKVYGGTPDAANEIFRGKISAIECEIGPETPPLFTVLAEDRLQALRKTRRTATYQNTSIADVVRTIASSHGLTPSVRDALSSPTSTWVQMNESDLAFLQRLLHQFDADMQVVGDELQVTPHSRDGRGTRELRYADNLTRVRVTADLADQSSEVRVSSWNPSEGSAVTGTATTGTLGPGEGRTGFELVKNALDIERREHVGHHGPMTQQEANALARAAFSQRARHFMRIEGTAQGDPALRVGTFVTLKQVNPLFAVNATVVETCHRYDLLQGYCTDFVAEGAHLRDPG